MSALGNKSKLDYLNLFVNDSSIEALTEKFEQNKATYLEEEAQRVVRCKERLKELQGDLKSLLKKDRTGADPGEEEAVVKSSQAAAQALLDAGKSLKDRDVEAVEKVVGTVEEAVTKCTSAIGERVLLVKEQRSTLGDVAETAPAGAEKAEGEKHLKLRKEAETAVGAAEKEATSANLQAAQQAVAAAVDHLNEVGRGVEARATRARKAKEILERHQKADLAGASKSEKEEIGKLLETATKSVEAALLAPTEEATAAAEKDAAAPSMLIGKVLKAVEERKNQLMEIDKQIVAREKVDQSEMNEGEKKLVEEKLNRAKEAVKKAFAEPVDGVVEAVRKTYLELQETVREVLAVIKLRRADLESAKEDLDEAKSLFERFKLAHKAAVEQKKTFSTELKNAQKEAEKTFKVCFNDVKANKVPSDEDRQAMSEALKEAVAQWAEFEKLVVRPLMPSEFRDLFEAAAPKSGEAYNVYILRDDVTGWLGERWYDDSLRGAHAKYIQMLESTFGVNEGEFKYTEQPKGETFVGSKGNYNAANLKQALNDAFGSKGKATGYKYNGKEILHASAGSPGKAGGCTVFFIRHDEGVEILGAGQHSGPASYDILWKKTGSGLPDKVALG